jgi:hypothetical protein
MKPINWLSKEKGKEVQTMEWLWSIGARYPQAKDTLSKMGFQLPKDQWEAFIKLIDTQLALSSRLRQEESKSDII